MVFTSSLAKAYEVYGIVSRIITLFLSTLHHSVKSFIQTLMDRVGYPSAILSVERAKFEPTASRLQGGRSVATEAEI